MPAGSPDARSGPGAGPTEAGDPWPCCSTSRRSSPRPGATGRTGPAHDLLDEPLLLGALSLGEADHVLQRELGQPATLALVDALTSGAIRVVTPTEADLVHAAALLVEHAEHRPRLSDALLVAAAARLGVRRVATFDRRPLAVLSPRGPRGERLLDLEP